MSQTASSPTSETKSTTVIHVNGTGVDRKVATEVLDITAKMLREISRNIDDSLIKDLKKCDETCQTVKELQECYQKVLSTKQSQ